MNIFLNPNSNELFDISKTRLLFLGIAEHSYLFLRFVSSLDFSFSVMLNFKIQQQRVSVALVQES